MKIIGDSQILNAFFPKKGKKRIFGIFFVQISLHMNLSEFTWISYDFHLRNVYNLHFSIYSSIGSSFLVSSQFQAT